MTEDQKKFKNFLDSRHHHEILPTRLYLISRIQKSLDPGERKMYKDRYDILEKHNPNLSWKGWVDKIWNKK
jgi:hypothetical protein